MGEEVRKSFEALLGRMSKSKQENRQRVGTVVSCIVDDIYDSIVVEVELALKGKRPDVNEVEKRVVERRSEMTQKLFDVIDSIPILDDFSNQQPEPSTSSTSQTRQTITQVAPVPVLNSPSQIVPVAQVAPSPQPTLTPASSILQAVLVQTPQQNVQSNGLPQMTVPTTLLIMPTTSGNTQPVVVGRTMFSPQQQQQQQQQQRSVPPKSQPNLRPRIKAEPIDGMEEITAIPAQRMVNQRASVNSQMRPPNVNILPNNVQQRAQSLSNNRARPQPQNQFPFVSRPNQGQPRPNTQHRAQSMPPNRSQANHFPFVKAPPANRAPQQQVVNYGPPRAIAPTQNPRFAPPRPTQQNLVRMRQAPTVQQHQQQRTQGQAHMVPAQPRYIKPRMTQPAPNQPPMKSYIIRNGHSQLMAQQQQQQQQQRQQQQTYSRTVPSAVAHRPVRIKQEVEDDSHLIVNGTRNQRAPSHANLPKHPIGTATQVHGVQTKILEKAPQVNGTAQPANAQQSQQQSQVVQPSTAQLNGHASNSERNQQSETPSESTPNATLNSSHDSQSGRATPSRRSGRVMIKRAIQELELEQSEAEMEDIITKHRRTSLQDTVQSAALQALASPANPIDDIGEEYSNKFTKAHVIILSVSCFVEGCEQTFPSRKDLFVHTETEHEIYEFRCLKPDCMKSFKKFPQLGPHIRIYHKNAMWPCHLCPDLVFDKASKLNNHHRFVHETGEYKCSSCDFKAPTTLDVAQHVRAVHSR